MRAFRGLGLAVWALLACLSFAVVVPSAHAADDCSSFDETVNNNRSAHQQDLMKYAMNVMSQVPLIPANNPCNDALMNLMKLLPVIADPLGIAASAVAAIISSLMGQICSAVMGTITAATSALTGIAKICIPSPKFNINLEVPSFGSGVSCSGGTSYSLLSTTSSGASAMSFVDFLK